MNARGHLRAVLAIVGMMTICCNRIAGPDTIAARRSVSDRVMLLTPNGKSYIARPFDGSEKIVPVGDLQPVSFAPDLSVYAFTQVVKAESGPRPFSIVLARTDGSRVPLLSVPDGSDLPKWKLRWGGSSGYPVLVQIDNRLFLFCGDHNERLLATDVIDFDVGGDRVWLLRMSGDRKEIVESRLSGDDLAAAHRVDVAREITGIVWLNETHVVGFATAPDLGIKERLSLIDVTSGRISSVAVPTGVNVLDVIPIRGTSQLILDEWRGEERVDGTLLSKFYLLDLATGKHTWLWSNHANERLHERPTNAARLSCPQP